MHHFHEAETLHGREEVWIAIHKLQFPSDIT